MRLPRTKPPRWAPSWMAGGPYQRRWLWGDLTAGIALTALIVPAGMGYAQASGLAPVSGLAASVMAMLAYALVGPSRIMVVGPDSGLTPLIAAAIVANAVTNTARNTAANTAANTASVADPRRAVALGALLGVMVGLTLLAAGLLRLGFVADLLSKPIRIGYLNGVAVTVIASQLPKLCGFSASGDGLVDQIRRFARGVRRGATVDEALLIGLAVIATVVVLRALLPRGPWVLVAIVGAVVAVKIADLEHKVPVVGRLDRNTLVPRPSTLEWGDIRSLLPAAMGIALVAFADTGLLSRAMAARHKQQIDESHEMAALGLANIAAGLGGGFPVSSSASRTPTAEAAGANTQVTSVVAALLTAGFVLVTPSATRLVPTAALAGVVIAAALSLVDVRASWKLARASRTESLLSLVAFLGVAFFGVLPGIGAAITLSMVAFVVKAWRPHTAELVRIEGRKGYHDVGRHPEGDRIPGLFILRFDAPLFFANASFFSELVRGAGHRIAHRPGAGGAWIIVAAEPITDIDTTAADELVALDDELGANGIHLVFAELKGPVKDRLRRLGLDTRFGPERQFPTLGTAVDAYLAATGTPWVDWDERPPEGRTTENPGA